MNNKKLNVILLGLILIFGVIFLILINLYNRNEESKIFFNKKDLYNNTWVNDDSILEINKNKLYIKLDGKVLVDNNKFDINSRSGLFSIESFEEDIYLRSVNSDYIVIWYNKAEYHLNKKIVNK